MINRNFILMIVVVAISAYYASADVSHLAGGE